MALDAYKNFSKVTVSTGYDAAATSIVLSGGDGAKLPAASFNVTWWNSTDYSDPTDDPNVEIVRVTAIATDTLTVTRAQEGTSASTKNTAGKTYKMAAPLTAKALNTDLYAVLSNTGLLLPNAKLIDASGRHLASGDNDLYTVPANRRALVSIGSFYNDNGTSTTVKAQVKVSGTYYRVYSDVVVSSNAGSVPFGTTQSAMVIEANDIFSLNTSQSNVNAWFVIVEFDNTSPMKAVRLLGPASGDNTLYTVAAGKKAIVMDLGTSLVPWATSSLRVSLFVVSDGSSRTWKANFVPSGGSATTTNQISASQSVASNTRAAFTPSAVLNASDFINVNVDVGNAAQSAWAVVVEV